MFREHYLATKGSPGPIQAQLHMQNIKTVLHNENKQVEVSLTAFVPLSPSTPSSVEDWKGVRERLQKRGLEILKAFSDIIVVSLEKRASECYLNFLTHINEASALDADVFFWFDEDGVEHTFNQRSYRDMVEVISSFKKGDFPCLYRNPRLSIQVIKALLEYNEDHREREGYRFQDLSTLLVCLSSECFDGPTTYSSIK